ncbi:hypothetical protein ACIQWA_39765 [Kitasatospora sp. NPDC098652]|uniref:hypothetical protein n=1 Tax=Kitasatospora sp. NPDC098652 TaxID=3364095 RepID=UPI0038254E61
MKFITTHPARIYAVLVAALALVAHYVPSLPSALVLGLAAAVLGTGEAVQRAEDGKTARALAKPVPVEVNDHYDQHQDDERDQAPAQAALFQVSE